MCKSPNCKHKRKDEKKICTVSGCGGSFKVVRGLCNAHWLRWKRGDKAIKPLDPEFESTDGKSCSVGGCRNKVYSKGLCNPHYHRKMRNGSEHDVRQMRHGSIKESRPDLYAQLVNKKNGRLTLGAREMVEWSCDECGKTYRATVYSRTLLGTGHQDCARKHVGEKNKIPAIGESLLDKFPEVAAQMVDADPSKVKPFSRDLYNWKCKGCSRVRRFTPSNFIANKSFYCRKCRPGGHDETGASFVYLMHRPGQIQYGIMNIWTDRLKTHARNGWSLLEKIEVTGQKARSLETKIKQTLRAKGVPTGRKAFRSPFDGSTEAFQEVDLSVRTIRELCDFLGINLDAFLAA